MSSNLGGVYLAIVENNQLDERGRISIAIPIPTVQAPTRLHRFIHGG